MLSLPSLRRSFLFSVVLAPALAFADGDTRDRPGRVELRLQHLVDELAAGERARTIDPAWRGVERAVVDGFHPPREAVTTRTNLQLLVAQYREALRRGAPNGRFGAGDPAEWTRVEVEARVDGNGKLLEARVVSPSGRAPLDALALEAVRAALGAHPAAPTVAAGAARVRFAVAAAVAITPPESSALIPTNEGASHAAGIKLGRWHFDETRTKARDEPRGKTHDLDWVLEQNVLTDVKIIGVTRE